MTQEEFKSRPECDKYCDDKFNEVYKQFYDRSFEDRNTIKKLKNEIY